MKPAKFKNHVTLAELARLVGKTTGWLDKLEKDGRIPQAARHRYGKIPVRLWSPAQVDEIRIILSKMKPGRPRKN